MPLSSNINIKEIDILHSVLSKIRSPKIKDEKEYQTICACDVSYQETRKKKFAIAAAISYNQESREVIQRETVISENPLPYVPGYFFIRELPPIVSVLRKIRSNIDVILVEGHGLLHPQKSGLAVYVGVFFDKPTIGIAKSLQVGKVIDQKQSISPIIYENRVLGNRIFSSNIDRRYYVSVGYKISLEKATKMVFTLLSQGMDLMHMVHLLSKTLIS